MIQKKLEKGKRMRETPRNLSYVGLKDIKKTHVDFYDFYLNKAITEDFSAPDLTLDPTTCQLGKWIIANDYLDDPTVNKIKLIHNRFHEIASIISKSKSLSEVFPVLMEFEEIKDSLSILIDEIITTPNKQKKTYSPDKLVSTTQKITKSFSRKELDLVFENIGTQKSREELLQKISNMEYNEAIRTTSLLIEVLSAMDTSVKSINNDFNKVSNLRDTLIEIEEIFVKASSQQQPKTPKIKSQLMPKVNEYMYNEWLDRLK